MPRAFVVSLLLVLSPLGCGGGGHPGAVAPAATASAPTPAADAADVRPGPWPEFAQPAALAAEEAALAHDLAAGLTRELALDPTRAAAVEACIVRAWSDLRAEAVRRAERAEDLSAEAWEDERAARDARLEAEITTLLTPDQRAAYEAFVGAREETP